MVIRALAHEDLEAYVGSGEFLEEVADLLLAHGGREVVLALVNEIRGNVGVEVVERADAYPLEHHADIFLCLRKIAEFAHYVYLFGDLCVCFGAEERVEFGSVAHLHLDDPG